MNSRIEKLRNQSLNATNSISSERAMLITQFYKNEANYSSSVAVTRAKAFDHILSNKHICINDGELIVGERGPSPKATPTYPEICIHTIDDLQLLNNREKVSFHVDKLTFKEYDEVIIPFWKGQTNRERIMNAMSNDWLEAYSAGIFTEFQEQRAPGHTVCGDKIYKKGMIDIINDIDQSLNQLDFQNDSRAFDKREELMAMRICAKALINWAKRHADKLEELSKKEKNEQRREELTKMAAICRKVPANAPETFNEALQYYWFVHLGVVTELNPWDSFNPGRLDQHLFSFYQNDIEKKRLTKEQAKELLQAFWIKFNNHPSPPKVGVTAQESSTYTDFCLINIGGVKPDGSDGTNELSFLILDVIEEMRLLQPSSMLQLSKRNPDSLLERTIEIVKTGFGQPSIFNSEAIVDEMLAMGKDIVDARNGGASGCVETGAFGTEAYFLTGYFNLPKVLEITLHNGTDPRTNKAIGIRTGEISGMTSYDELLLAFTKQLNHFINIKIRGNNIIERVFANNLPVPFLSLVIEDCVTTGIDYIEGGARYNTSYIQGVGIGTIVDSLAAIKQIVFEEKRISLLDFKNTLSNNFKEQKQLHFDLVYNCPKYGNDNEKADNRLREVFDIYFDAINGKPNTRGGVHRVNLLPTTCHVYFGSVVGATADGRKRGEPLSEGISPVQGADQNGPTAVLKSAAKIDHLRTGGTLLNQRFTPDFFTNNQSIEKVVHLVRSYFRMDGHHIQFNVVSSDLLRDAQKHPEQYKDLIVRVAGYSDYFNDLGEDLQNEIINRTAHQEC